MKLTRELIHSVATSHVGFNRFQLSILGVQWPPKKGWLSNLVGKEISDSDFDRLRHASTNSYKSRCQRVQQTRLGNIKAK